MFKKNLNQIVSSFAKTVSQLEGLQDRNSVGIEKNVAEINRLSDENSGLFSESEKAKRIAEKLRAILQ